MKKLLVFLSAIFFAFPVFAACTSTQIDVTGSGTNCQTAKFSLTTTSITSFQFVMSAVGTFYVDCGNGGTLKDSSNNNLGKTITRSDATEATYTCSWTGSASTKTIRFGGEATNYSTGTTTAAIRFNVGKGGTDTNAAKIAAVSGDLSAIFKYITTNTQSGAQPRFYMTFYAATNLTELPGTLFAGYTTPSTYMFPNTFRSCTKLTTVPAALFSRISGAASYLFSNTFRGCSKITSLPENLFAGISGSASYMFNSTFYDCTLLESIPENLFEHVSGAATYMFNGTFYNCTSLTSVPEKLFKNVSGAASYMFNSTFYNCSALTSVTNGSTTMSYVPGTFIRAVADGTATKSAPNMFSGTALLDSCPTGTITDTPTQLNNAGKPWCTQTFSLTTTSTTTSFQFIMSAAGNFTVDCGDGGTLSGTGVSGNTITRSDVTEATYTCDWGNNAGEHTIRFSGTATNYSASTSTAAIRFSIVNSTDDTNAEKIASVSGNLSTIFPYISTNAADGAQPRFYRTFSYATNLTSVPDTLFTNYTTGANNMFERTFASSGLTLIPEKLFENITNVSGTSHLFAYTFLYCTSLTSIPALFKNITNISGTSNLFYCTFYGCTSLISISENLFKNVSGAADSLFNCTFYGCTGLESIPENLFKNVSGAADNMFEHTFHSCTGLTSLPENLFKNVSGAATYMFSGTFYGCKKLTSLPENLFAGVSGAAVRMFNNTFYGCRGLTSIPKNLFAGVSGAADYMFFDTFYACSKLASITNGQTSTSYIPGDFLSAVADGTSTKPAGSMFSGTALSKPCPAGTHTDTPEQFSNVGKPWCTPCAAGTYTSESGQASCSACDESTQYQDETGATSCKNVSAGWYKSSNSAQAQCPVNYRTGAAASSISGCTITCTAGTSVATPNDSCVDVGDGYYTTTSQTISYGSTGTRSACSELASKYTNSDSGRNSATDCYLTTSQKEYVAAAGANPVDCAADGYCPGNVKVYYNSTGGRTACATGLFAPAKAYRSAQCGHKIHIDDANFNDVIYLHSDKLTTPSLNVRWDNQTWYANMTQTATNMSSTSQRKFKSSWDGNTYYVCDDTICDPNNSQNANPDLMTLIGTQAGYGYVAFDSNGSTVDEEGSAANNTFIPNKSMAFVVNYGDQYEILGYGRCSTQPAPHQYDTVDTLTNETGMTGAQYCYCHLDSLRPYSEPSQSGENSTAPWVATQDLSSSWVYFYDIEYYDECQYSCSYSCAYSLWSGEAWALAFRSAIFNSVNN